MKLKQKEEIKRGKEKREEKPSMKYVERNNIFFVGFDELHPDDQARIKEIVYNEYISLERELKQINSIKLTFKVYDKGGKKKYSVKMLIDAHTHPITVDNMYSPAEWDAVACVHKAIEKAKKEIIHRFRTDTSFKKPYGKGAI